MDDKERLQLNVDLGEIHSRSDYKEIWARIPPVEAVNISTNEKRKHALGVRFIYKNQSGCRFNSSLYP